MEEMDSKKKQKTLWQTKLNKKKEQKTYKKWKRL